MIELSWDEIRNYIYKITHQFKDFVPEVIVGVPRGGSFVSAMISYALQAKDKDVFSPTSLPKHYGLPYDHHTRQIVEEDVPPVKGKRVLIADDGSLSGATIKSIRKQIVDAGAKEVRIAVLCYNEEISEIEPDFYALLVTDIVYFPWRAMFGLKPHMETKLLFRWLQEHDLTVALEGSIIGPYSLSQLDSAFACLNTEVAFTVDRMGKVFVVCGDFGSIAFEFSQPSIRIELNLNRNLHFTGEFSSIYARTLSKLIKDKSERVIPMCSLLDFSLPLITFIFKTTLRTQNIGLEFRKLSTKITEIPKTAQRELLDLLNSEVKKAD